MLLIKRSTNFRYAEEVKTYFSEIRTLKHVSDQLRIGIFQKFHHHRKEHDLIDQEPVAHYWKNSKKKYLSRNDPLLDLQAITSDMKYSCNPIIEPPFVQRSANRSVNYREIQDFLFLVSKNLS